MKYVIFLFLALLISCNNKISSKTKDLNCKQAFLESVEVYTDAIELGEHGIYNLNIDHVPLPDSYDTIRWKSYDGYTSGLDSTNTRLMLIHKAVNSFRTIQCDNPFSKYEIENVFGKSSINTLPNNNVYYYNRLGEHNCFDPSDLTSKYNDCGLIIFGFNKENYLTKISAGMLFPVLLIE